MRPPGPWPAASCRFRAARTAGCHVAVPGGPGTSPAAGPAEPPVQGNRLFLCRGRAGKGSAQVPTASYNARLAASRPAMSSQATVGVESSTSERMVSLSCCASLFGAGAAAALVAAGAPPVGPGAARTAGCCCGAPPWPADLPAASKQRLADRCRSFDGHVLGLLPCFRPLHRGSCWLRFPVRFLALRGEPRRPRGRGRGMAALPGQVRDACLDLC